MSTSNARRQTSLITFKKCRICKKDIPIRFIDEYRYKDSRGYYCSWSCLQASRRKAQKTYSASDLAYEINATRGEITEWIRAGLMKAEYKGRRGDMYKISIAEFDRVAREGREVMRQRHQKYLEGQRKKLKEMLNADEH